MTQLTMILTNQGFQIASKIQRFGTFPSAPNLSQSEEVEHCVAFSNWLEDRYPSKQCRRTVTGKWEPMDIDIRSLSSNKLVCVVECKSSQETSRIRDALFINVSKIEHVNNHLLQKSPTLQVYFTFTNRDGSWFVEYKQNGEFGSKFPRAWITGWPKEVYIVKLKYMTLFATWSA
jgi:hypothetical protein